MHLFTAKFQKEVVKYAINAQTDRLNLSIKTHKS